MDVTRHRRTAIQRAAWTLFALLSVGGLASSAVQAQDSVSHISILREDLFESGLGADPKGIAQSHDGGLVVAGSIGNLAWATRIGPTGHVIWRYLLPPADNLPIGDHSNYAAAVQLPDDSTVLCGTRTVSYKPQGLLTHISASGALIGQELLDPKGFYIDIRYCERYRDGAVAVGIDSTNVAFFRIVSVDTQGQRIGDHLLEAPETILHDVVTDGQDIVLAMSGGMRDAQGRAIVATRLLRVDSSGSVKTDRTIAGGGFYLHPMADSSTVSLFLEPENENSSQLKTLGPSFEDESMVNGPAVNVSPTRSFLSTDGSLVFCGYTQVGGNSYSASITWLSPGHYAKDKCLCLSLFSVVSKSARRYHRGVRASSLL
jgi:hypothetical protein